MTDASLKDYDLRLTDLIAVGPVSYNRYNYEAEWWPSRGALLAMTED